METIDYLVLYWQKEGVVIKQNDLDKIKRISLIKNVDLPSDFIEYFQKVNGMVNYYPNDCDSNGFLFYPIEELVTMDVEFAGRCDQSLRDVIIFANYLQKSWLYGLNVTADGRYNIGLVVSRNTFSFIAASFDDFLKMYMRDCDELYP